MQDHEMVSYSPSDRRASEEAATCFALAPLSTPSTASAAEAKQETSDFVHLRPLRASGTKPPLFCFFPGPPGARDLAAALPADQPVYEFFWPNMDEEASYPTVEQLAALFVPEILRVNPHGPYQLCGYSTFGLVAYEIGRSLLSEGKDVPLLALFDIWHPQFRQTLSGRQKARYQVLRIIDRIGKYLRMLQREGVGHAAAKASASFNNKVKAIAWRVVRLRYRTTGIPVPKAVAVIEAIAANQTYTPQPYPRPFILVRPNDLLDRKLTDQTVGWYLCATEGVRIYFVQGDHGTIKDQPYVSDLVAKITPHLAGEVT